MKNKPLITIITVTRNLIEAGRIDFFKQCLESVHNQTYENIEHIIIDGASNDGTVDLIKQYADKGWVKYISEPDNSIYEAMNKGAELANGEYLAFLNSDDYYSDLKGIEKSIKQLVKTNSDFSFAKCKMLTDNKDLLINNLQPKTRISCVFVEMPFCHQTMIVKTDVFKNLGMYNLKYKSAGDYEFVLKMMLNKCTYIKCNFNFVTFRLGGFSIQNKNLSHEEIADFFSVFYGETMPLTKEEFKKIYVEKVMPFPLIKKVLSYLTLSQKVDFLIYEFAQRHYFKRFRRFLISFRYGNKEKYFKVFGKNLINTK